MSSVVVIHRCICYRPPCISIYDMIYVIYRWYQRSSDNRTCISNLHFHFASALPTEMVKMVCNLFKTHVSLKFNIITGDELASRNQIAGTNGVHAIALNIMYELFSNAQHHWFPWVRVHSFSNSVQRKGTDMLCCKWYAWLAIGGYLLPWATSHHVFVMLNFKGSRGYVAITSVSKDINVFYIDATFKVPTETIH